jgi:hypothetical protein
VQNAQIMQISGHKNVQSVNTYSRLNQNRTPRVKLFLTKSSQKRQSDDSGLQIAKTKYKRILPLSFSDSDSE